MNEPVQKTAVVGEEQNARRIDVEASDGLYAAATQRRGKKRHDGGMRRGLERALVARGLVKGQNRLFSIGPGLSAHDKGEAFGFKVLVRIVADHAPDLHETASGNRPAVVARAEALGKRMSSRIMRSPQRGHS